MSAHSIRRLGAIVLCACLLTTLPFSAYAKEGVSVREGESSKKIALTFDDGPSAEYTAKILDILQKYNVKATFFVIGVNAQKHPDLLGRIISDGHEVGNHTYSHPHLQKMDEFALLEELNKADEVFQKLCGISPTLFRPPEGVVSNAVKAAAQSKGYTMVLWNIDTRDWALNNADNIIRLIDKQASDGDIVLFHDWVAGKSPTPAALEIIIPRLQARGFEFVKVSEL